MSSIAAISIGSAIARCRILALYGSSSKGIHWYFFSRLTLTRLRTSFGIVIPVSCITFSPSCVWSARAIISSVINPFSTRTDMYPEFWTHIYKLGGHHGCFSVFYRRHPFCFCLDSFAIIVINIFINSNCKFFK